MSFGDPNNPYAQPPQGGQPAYGYPPQAPQGIPPQGGYAYPPQGQGGYPAPGGYPGADVPMPGGVKGARVVLFILGGFEALAGLFIAVGGALFASALSESSSSSTSDMGAVAGGVFVVAGLFLVALSLWPILTAAKLSKGRGGVRVSGIIFGSLQTFFSGAGLIVNIATFSSVDDSAGAIVLVSMLPSLIAFGLGLWIVIGLANSAAGQYFRRPLY
ncbi:DUF3824 domain-containing protein [Streptomyces sp. NPDC002104]